MKKLLIVAFSIILIQPFSIRNIRAAEIPTNPSNFKSNLSNANPGDTLLLENGNYPTFASTKNGTATNPITIKSKNPLGAKFEHNSNIILLTHNYWVIDGLSIKKGTVKETVIVDIYGNHNTIKNSKIWRNDKPFTYSTGAQAYGQATRDNAIVLRGTDNIVDNNEIFGVQWCVRITGNGAFRQKIVNNKLYGTAQSPIIIHGPDNKPSQTLIENNWISYSGIEDGIQFDGTAGKIEITKLVIRNNVFEGNGENAIDTKATGSILIENNVFVDTKGSNDGCYSACSSSNEDAWKTSNWVTGGGDHSYPVTSKGSRKESDHIIKRNNVVYANANGFEGFTNDRTYNNVIIYNNLYPPLDYDDTSNPYTSGNSHSGYITKKGGTQGIKNNIIGGHNGNEINIDSGASIDKASNLFFPGTRPVKFNGYSMASNDKKLNTLAEVGFINIVEKITDKDYAKYNFFVKNTSPAYEAGSHLTTVTAASGNEITVQDSKWFGAADWAVGYNGDTITINNQTAQINSIDGNKLSLNKSVNAAGGDKVYWGNTSKPNIGLIEGSTIGLINNNNNPTPINTVTPTTGEPTPTSTPTDEPSAKFDIDKNGSINFLDVIEMLKYLFR